MTSTPTDLNAAAWDRLHTQRRHALNYPNESVVRFLVSNRDKLNAKTMLDIGCAAGRHMKLAAELGYEPQGVDSSPEALEQAGQYGPVVLADMTALPFPDDHFDVVVALGTLYYGTRDITRQALAEIRRVLAINGHGLVTLRTDRDWHAICGARVDAQTIVFEFEDEPENGMVMNFADTDDLNWIAQEFAGAQCDLVEETSGGGKRRASDWLIVVRKG